MPKLAGRSWKTHPLAIIALACSLVLCCPVTSFLGVILGWFSLRTINASEGRLRGRKLAIWAIILGVLMLPIQFLLQDLLETRVDELIDKGVERCVVNVFDIDMPDRAKGLQRTFAPVRSKYPTPEAVDAFANAVTDQLGAYQSVSIVQRSSSRENLLETGVQLALVFTFERGTAIGGADCVLVPYPPSIWPDVRLQLLEIDLPDKQTLRIPIEQEQPQDVEDVQEQSGSVPAGDEE